jgi:hypothetical protein
MIHGEEFRLVRVRKALIWDSMTRMEILLILPMTLYFRLQSKPRIAKLQTHLLNDKYGGFQSQTISLVRSYFKPLP